MPLQRDDRPIAKQHSLERMRNRSQQPEVRVGFMSVALLASFCASSACGRGPGSPALPAGSPDSGDFDLAEADLSTETKLPPWEVKPTETQPEPDPETQELDVVGRADVESEAVETTCVNLPTGATVVSDIPVLSEECDDGDECTSDYLITAKGKCLYTREKTCTQKLCISDSDCTNGVCTSSADCRPCEFGGFAPGVGGTDKGCPPEQYCVHHTCRYSGVCGQGGSGYACFGGSVCSFKFFTPLCTECSTACPSCPLGTKCDGMHLCEPWAPPECTFDGGCLSDEFCDLAMYRCVPDLCSGSTCFKGTKFNCKADGSGYSVPMACDGKGECKAEACI